MDRILKGIFLGIHMGMQFDIILYQTVELKRMQKMFLSKKKMMKRKSENLGNSKAQITADTAEEILKYMTDVCLWDGCVTHLMFV